jgi:hypothetical protein
LETTAKLTTGDGEFAMHIAIYEAIAILDSWKAGETLLHVHVSIVGHGRKFQATACQPLFPTPQDHPYRTTLELVSNSSSFRLGAVLFCVFPRRRHTYSCSIEFA